MSRKFNVEIVPNSEHDVAALGLLEQHLGDYYDRHGSRQCATLGQVKFWGEKPISIEGRMFTGEAMQYLMFHMRAGAAMQDEQESTPEDIRND